MWSIEKRFRFENIIEPPQKILKPLIFRLIQLKKYFLGTISTGVDVSRRIERRNVITTIYVSVR